MFASGTPGSARKEGTNDEGKYAYSNLLAQFQLNRFVVCVSNGLPESRGSLLVRAPDSRSEGCEFESRQEQRENFLLQSQLCLLILVRCPVHPVLTQ